MAVVFKYIMKEVPGPFVACRVVSGVGPLACDSLYETFRLAVGLRSVGTGKLVLDAKGEAGSGKGMRAVAYAVVGKDALNFDAMESVEAYGSLQGGYDAGDFLVWHDAGIGETGVIVDGDVEGFYAGALAAIGAVAGATNAGTFEASELFDVEVEQFTRVLPFVADDRRRRRFKRSEMIQSMATQNA